MADSEKSPEKTATKDEEQSTKQRFYFPEVDGTSFSVEADSPEEAEKLAKQARKDQQNG